MVITREGALQTKNADESNVKWEERFVKLDALSLTTLDRDTRSMLSRFKLSDVMNISSEGNCRFNFECEGVFVRMKAKSAEIAEDWCRDLQDAKAEVENASRGNEKEENEGRSKQSSRMSAALSKKDDRLDPSPSKSNDGVSREDRRLIRKLLNKAYKANAEAIDRKISKNAGETCGYSEMQTTIRKLFKVPKESLSNEVMFELCYELDTAGDGNLSMHMLLDWLANPASDDDAYYNEETSPWQLIRGRIKVITNSGSQDMVEKFYLTIDKSNRYGLVLKDFLKSVRKNLKFGPEEVTDEQVMEIYKAIDTNDKGALTMDEFSEFVVGDCDSLAAKLAEKENKPGAEFDGSAPSVSNAYVVSDRIKELYASHERKMQKMAMLQKARDADEIRQIEESRLKAKLQGSKNRYRMSQLHAGSAAARLYQDFFESANRLREKQRYYGEQERHELEVKKMMNLPTRSGSVPVTGTSKDAGRRLYMDAERRERDRQQARDAYEMEQERVYGCFKRGHTDITTRHMDLYDEATARRERLDRKRAEAEETMRKELEAESVSRGNGRGPNADRLEELHREHAVRQRKLAVAVAEKQMREAEEVQKATRRARVVRQKRPSIVDDPRSPRSIRSPQRAQAEADKLHFQKRKAEETEKKKKVHAVTQADHCLAAMIQMIQTRCGYAPGVDSVFDSQHQHLAQILKDAMAVYREALKNCEASEGFASLCARASQRLFGEHLLPEHEGFARCIEPDPIRQVEDDLEDLLKSAQLAQVELKELVAGSYTNWPEGTVRAHPDGVPIALFAYDPGVKGELAAAAKAITRYGPAEGNHRHRHITDLARLLLVFSSCDILQAGLDQIMRRFEVVHVKNYFANPGLLGVRFVEVLVIVQVGEGQSRIPHVCELRLEELCYHRAQELAAPHMDLLYKKFRDVYNRAGRHQDAVLQLVHTVLNKPLQSHDLRVFKCHLAKRFGTSICGWRRALGGGRLLNFQKFREVCQKLNCSEHTTEFWVGLDPTLSGCISIFDLDPEATGLLIKFRTRLLALADLGSNPKDVDAESIFARVSLLVRPCRPGHLEAQEFRAVGKPLGVVGDEADKVFSHLDFYGGNHAPPATITVQDIAWLIRLPNLVDIEAVTLSDATKANENEELRRLAWARSTTRHSRRGELLRCTFARGIPDSNASLPSSREPGAHLRRSMSEEPRRSDVRKSLSVPAQLAPDHDEGSDSDKGSLFGPTPRGSFTAQGSSPRGSWSSAAGQSVPTRVRRASMFTNEEPATSPRLSRSAPMYEGAGASPGQSHCRNSELGEASPPTHSGCNRSLQNAAPPMNAQPHRGVLGGGSAEEDEEEEELDDEDDEDTF
eukprot:CAMPEP_0117535020 /NCGR_PEP_ID=MMETSP0784-20121206/40716_1 /TAXON_ID=39447 /ORGANISM="" /LENGTH=1345 /DNA_ID=CAMNT_0005331527 /DNA_START=60 /DNA_END=4097 /DNA_ORIENTATION=+